MPALQILGAVPCTLGHFLRPPAPAGIVVDRAVTRPMVCAEYRKLRQLDCLTGEPGAGEKNVTHSCGMVCSAIRQLPAGRSGENARFADTRADEASFC